MRNFFPVAKYESIMLLRTWKFWILAALGMFFPILINVVFIIIERVGESMPGWLVLQGSRPYFFFNFYNTIQIIIVIFLTSDFREKDKKHHVDMVMCSKSMTNFEYIFGKYFGIMIPLMMLTLGVLALLVIFNRIMNGTWSFEYYLTYFLVMNMPGLIFITAFVIFTSSLLRNTAVVFIVIMIYTAAMWKLSMDHAYEINNIWLFTDYIGMFLPLYPSDLVGIVSLDNIIMQRLFYILLGFFFIGMTISLFYPRLMQSRLFEWTVGIASIICLFGAFYIMYGFSETEAVRQQIAGNAKQAKGLPDEIVGSYRITNCDLDYTFWENHTPVQGNAVVTLSKVKNTYVDRIPFVLNPDLIVSSIKDGEGNELQFEHSGIDLLVDFQEKIGLDEKFELRFEFAGTIDDRVMFLNRGSNDKGESELEMDGPIHPAALDRKPNLMSPEYTYMIPESFWYPSLYNPYSFTYPDKRPISFFTGECRFNVPENRMAVSQGKLAEIDSVSFTDRRIYRFNREVPVKELTVNVGNYNRYSTNISGIDLVLYVSSEHNSLIEFFSEIKEDIKSALSDVFRGIKETTGLDYPYSTLSYVEVPVVFQWFQDNGLHRYLLSQSGVVLAPENMMVRSYQEQFDRSRRRADRRGIEKSDKEIKKEIFLDIIIDDMFSENWWNEESLPAPLSAFWSDRINISNELYPAYEYYFDKFLQGLITTKIRFFITNEEDTRWRRDFEDQFSDWIFQRTYDMPVDTMHYLVRNFTMNELSPSIKNNYFHAVMRYKGQKIHQLLREIMGEEEHKEILRKFIDGYSYKTSTISDFQEVCEEVLGESLDWYFGDWLRGKAFPGFYISSIDTYKLKGGKTGVQYLVEVSIKNGEPDFGYVKVLLRTENDAVQKNSEVEGDEEVRFAFLVDDQPEEIIIDPVFSQNHGSIRKKIQIPDRFDKRTPWEGIRKIKASFSFSNPVIIDDMDDNFSLKPIGDPKFFRPKEGERNWRVRTDSDAYGKYKFTYRRKEAGSGMVPAVWTTDLRASGIYDVQVYVFKGNNQWVRRHLERNISPEFYYIIEHGEGTENIELSWNSVPHGWNSIGRFYFDKDKPAKISLEDRGDGLLVADAVQLIPIRVTRTNGKQ